MRRYVRWLALSCLLGCAHAPPESASVAARPEVVVIVSADTEWKVLLAEMGESPKTQTAYGAWFVRTYAVAGEPKPVVFFHGGWGKVSAAGSAQYAIDTWKPRLLVVLGTCGGLEGAARKGDIVLARRTLIYDVIERMGSADEALAAYAVDLDTSLVPSEVRAKVREELLVSADQDIAPADVPRLEATFHAVAADWESGAIAYVASHNHTPLVVLKGVSDVVSPAGSETYGSMETFEASARQIMSRLLVLLQDILRRPPAAPR
ncbi:MAG TPA: 5'-methylthioadenosine/S-adenosylhomocysteine nucleosidase [Polyangiaceae bacterium]